MTAIHLNTPSVYFFYDISIIKYCLVSIYIGAKVEINLL